MGSAKAMGGKIVGVLHMVGWHDNYLWRWGNLRVSTTCTRLVIPCILNAELTDSVDKPMKNLPALVTLGGCTPLKPERVMSLLPAAKAAECCDRSALFRKPHELTATFNEVIFEHGQCFLDSLLRSYS